MKIYKLPELTDASPTNEYCLGLKDLNTHSVYLLHGRLRPGETGRKISPGRGHEEILFVVKGSITVRSDKYTFPVSAGEAFHAKGEETFFLDNPGNSEAVYIAAGGHSSNSRHGEEGAGEEVPETKQ